MYRACVDERRLDPCVLVFHYYVWRWRSYLGAIAFDLDTVKLLMTLFDTDRSGTIGFTEVRISLPPAYMIARRTDSRSLHLCSSRVCGSISRTGRTYSSTSTETARERSTARSCVTRLGSLGTTSPRLCSTSCRRNMVRPFLHLRKTQRSIAARARGSL